MAKQNGHNTANGVLSGIVTACGIAISVLLYKIMVLIVDEIAEDTVDNSDVFTVNDFHATYRSSPVWGFGFAFIVPGVIGVIAALTKAKGAYITHMVFSIISLLVMGVAFIVSIIGLGALAVVNPAQCSSSGDFCRCSHLEYSLNYTCEEMNAMYAMTVSMCVIVVLGWILSLTVTILSGILACRSEPSAGMVIQRMPPTTTVVQLAPTAGPPAYSPYLAQTTHDKAVLVNNQF